MMELINTAEQDKAYARTGDGPFGDCRGSPWMAWNL